MHKKVKNHTIYSDKFILSVVDLKHIELAIKEDKEYLIDYWAALFKATTWEDIKMIAEKNSYFKGASETLLQLTADEKIREQCEARKAYYARERHHQQVEQELGKIKEQLEEKDATIAEKDSIIARLTAEIAALKKENVE